MSAVNESIQKKEVIVSLLFFVLVMFSLLFEKEFTKIIDFGFATTTPNSVGIYYKVTKITDGDTIRIEMDGRNESVRLIGINTPETVDPRRTVECFGKEASERMKEIVGGKIVRLEYDDSQALRDTYDRLLAYVYLEDGQMLNRKMIAEGYAYEYTYLTPYRYQREFRDLQRLAQSSGRGLWASDTCNGSKQLPE